MLAAARVLAVMSLQSAVVFVTGQIYESGSCPTYYSSLLFTPEVMLDLIKRGEQYLVVTAGTPADPERSCHAISFHKEQTYSFSYRDSHGEKKILSGTYYVNFPTLTSTGSIVLNGLPNAVMGDGGSDSEPLTLYPVGYSDGITLFVSCRSYYFSFERRFFVFLDDEANLNWVNPRDIAMDLRKNDFFPEDMHYNLVNQTCSACKRAVVGACVDDHIVRPIQSLFSSIES